MPATELTKNDLFLLLEAYKNQLEMNQAIFEHQRQMGSQISQLTEQQRVLCQNIQKIEVKMEVLERKLETCVFETHRDVSEVEKKMKDNVGLIIAPYFEKVISKLNILYIAFGSIVIALIGLLITVLIKYHELFQLASNLPK